MSRKNRFAPAGHWLHITRGNGIGRVRHSAAGALLDMEAGDIRPPPLKTGPERGWERWIFAGGFVDGPCLENQARNPAFSETRYGQ